LRDRHSPARLSTYVRVHEVRMQQFRDSGFVTDDSLRLNAIGSGFLMMEGEIACLGPILVNVEKRLQIVDGSEDEARVQTLYYAYNASVQGHGNFLRHDNAHFAARSHADEHHAHYFDWRTGEERRVAWIGAAGWPTSPEIVRVPRRISIVSLHVPEQPAVESSP
jgi:hypothetical protein